MAQANSSHELSHAAQIPRPTKNKYDCKLAVITKYNLHQKELTVEHSKNKQLTLCPNCNISLKWRAQQGCVYIKLKMLQPGNYNSSKTCKQVDKKIQETVNYCNVLQQCTS